MINSLNYFQYQKMEKNEIIKFNLNKDCIFFILLSGKMGIYR